jgi:UDP-N-acetylmuramoyl-tripeptide--D-alanyl-D-alanine ligase
MSTEEIYREFLQSTGICTDTRQQVEGSLFFALRGEHFDGNRFVTDALKQGCRMAVTENREWEGAERAVVVDSVLTALQQLASLHRKQLAPRLVAITGSNGKTTTKELVASVLASGYRVIATRGNLNNHIGVPLTLLAMRNEEMAVVEMGANHQGEIAKLAEIADPDTGLITNVGKAHLEGFGSLQGVLGAKSELYSYLAAHGGRAIIDGSDTLLIQKAREIGVESALVGPGKQFDVSVSVAAQTPFLEVDLKMGKKVYPLATKMVGAYNTQNILLAAGTGLYFGIPAEDIIESIAGYLPENQRSQMVEGARNRVVLDAYNANPTSMREAISALMTYASSPVMLILGDMAELGEASEQEHRELARWIDTLKADRVLLTGTCFSAVCEPTPRKTVFSGRDELEDFLKKEKPEGYQILLKGSRVMELEKILPLLTG